MILPLLVTGRNGKSPAPVSAVQEGKVHGLLLLWSVFGGLSDLSLP